MDHRNNAIPYEKITARDVTDTQRRGTCLAASFVFGLAYELWAKMPLESGYQLPQRRLPAAPKAAVASPSKRPPLRRLPRQPTEATFREAALEKGVHTVAIDALVAIVGDKLGGDFEKGPRQAGSAEELNTKYGPKKDEDDPVVIHWLRLSLSSTEPRFKLSPGA